MITPRSQRQYIPDDIIIPNTTNASSMISKYFKMHVKLGSYSHNLFYLAALKISDSSTLWVWSPEDVLLLFRDLLLDILTGEFCALYFCILMPCDSESY